MISAGGRADGERSVTPLATSDTAVKPRAIARAVMASQEANANAGFIIPRLEVGEPRVPKGRLNLARSTAPRPAAGQLGRSRPWTRWIVAGNSKTSVLATQVAIPRSAARARMSASRYALKRMMR